MAVGFGRRLAGDRPGVIDEARVTERLDVEVRLRNGRRRDRRSGDRGRVDVRGRLGGKDADRVVAVRAVLLDRARVVTAEAGESQHRERDGDQDETYPHPVIVVAAAPGVKERGRYGRPAE